MGGDAVTDHLAAGQAKAFEDRIERIEGRGAGRDQNIRPLPTSDASASATAAASSSQ